MTWGSLPNGGGRAAGIGKLQEVGGVKLDDVAQTEAAISSCPPTAPERQASTQIKWLSGKLAAKAGQVCPVGAAQLQDATMGLIFSGAAHARAEVAK